MRKLILSLVAALALAAAVPAAAQVDVSGEWEMTFDTPQGTLPATMTLKQDGTTLTGTISGPQGNLDVKGTIDGAVLKMEMEFDQFKVMLTAEVAGAAMKGEADYGQGSATFYGKRK